MKRIITYIILGFILTVSSCQSKLDDYGVNPNNPENSSPSLLLSSTEVGTFANLTGDLARQTNLFTQHVAGVDGQYQNYARYDINENDILNSWQTLFAGTMINANQIIVTYGNENPYYEGISQILMAMNLGLATDLWGDVPYSEAFNGLQRNFTPKFEPQEQVIADIQTLLDNAITNLKEPLTSNAFIPAADDIIFGGDVAKWIRSAYILKARYANRLSQVDPTGSATKALQDLAAADLSLKELDDMKAVFYDNNPSNYNQWAAFMDNRGYIRMGNFFINLLVTNNDPRLPFFAAKDDAGGYSGNSPSDITTNSTSAPGPGIASNGSPLPLVTYAEAQFIAAEANLRLGNAAAAATAHNEAVTSSVRAVTGAVPPAAFVTAFASETAGTISLQKIITQKYIALFTQTEPYDDYRRVGIPALTPNPNGVKPQIPLRYPTSIDERLYNPNATVVSDNYVPVWWDK
ncbi:SusD/RagB family nutrient-binding outer membrane lipoprotein [Solitalea sp. MAHUQ-68]|uniref:SusD/RagB family nutrient-binding outer membrane lipoprotein n=1 Tax=Solitalea agri TaxID=2953739 RepID=A0A9X2F2D6_9SPHI|nr:SusD/RagB family nutrient-binding outer membrane lipoprotein [Solitalea agri]MCO4293337.1 SusD/RagB family nutrient-binding outer membrane lipoprotein [Solitalea agri]